jgi:hypothetical protein
MAANTHDVPTAVQQLAGALLDEVERIAGRSAARVQEMLPSYAAVPAEALIPVTLTNTRNLLEAVADPDVDRGRSDDHFRLLGEARLRQGITADEMLQAWQIGLEVVREEAHPVAKRLNVTDAALLEFVEATLEWGDVGMRRSAAAYREGEMRELRRLTAEQSALRRVAEVIARQAPSDEVFAVVTEELSSLLGVSLIRTVRFEGDGSTTVVASLGKDADRMPPGTNVVWPAGSVTDQILRTGRPARLDDYTELTGEVAAILRDERVRCAAGGPVILGGRTWGAMVVASDTAGSLPPGSEDRIARFTELVSTAISNLESRAREEELAARRGAHCPPGAAGAGVRRGDGGAQSSAGCHHRRDGPVRARRDRDDHGGTGHSPRRVPAGHQHCPRRGKRDRAGLSDRTPSPHRELRPCRRSAWQCHA